MFDELTVITSQSQALLATPKENKMFTEIFDLYFIPGPQNWMFFEKKWIKWIVNK